MSYLFRGICVLSRAVFAVCAACFLLAAGPVFAASSMSVNLSSEASRPAANDLMQASLSAEATGAAPGELADQVNQVVADALSMIRGYPMIKVQNGGTSTYPIYAGDGSIQSWRMRSSILLESGDAPVLSELLGKLQASLAVSSLRLLPSPETRRKAEDAAILEAITLFEARAQLLADAQKKNYSIEELSISTGEHSMPAPLRFARNVSTSAAPMPIESGESMIGATVSGKIKIK
ncbi:MAG: SIMPL domain-containing protein [Candidatus Accumulibacter sp.]|jgi:predicted secreted protein|nr:SIMPL domain-containing protein [Accumulibacter sp.]